MDLCPELGSSETILFSMNMNKVHKCLAEMKASGNFSYCHSFDFDKTITDISVSHCSYGTIIKSKKYINRFLFVLIDFHFQRHVLFFNENFFPYFQTLVVVFLIIS